MRRLIELIVRAITRDAEKNLRSAAKEVQNLERTAVSAADEIDQSFTAVEKTMAFLEGAVKKMAAAAIAYLSAMAVRALADMAQMAAKAQAVADGFEVLSARAGLSADKIVEALKRASKGTVSEYDLILQANKALRLGVATTVEEFGALMKVAMVRAREFGITTAEAWEYIVTGIGRASPFILDNIGILMDAERTYTDYAESIGKTADQLDVLEKKEAIRQRILTEGASDLERWNELGDEAVDVFDRYEAAMADLRIELGEKLLPALVEVTTVMTDLLRIGESHEDWARRQEEAIWRTARTAEQAAIRMTQFRDAQEAAGRSATMGTKDWEEQTASLEAWQWVQERTRAGFEDIDIKMHDVAQRTRELGEAQEEATDDTEEFAEALEKASDILDDYYRDVAEAEYRFARQVEDAEFRATQAAEDAAFRRYEIEQNAADRSWDLMMSYQIRQRAQVANHYNRMRWMHQDHLDAMSDMEWEQQREREDIFRKAPYWVRNALKAEFDERERIRASGDTDALEAYDEFLTERIRMIDPAYAQELDLLQERHAHEEEIEKREFRKDRQRTQAQWRIRQTEQRQQLRLQQYQLERNLQNQLRAWEYHNQQRLERERWAMDRLNEQHRHALDRMYDDTNRRLADIEILWEHWGWTHGISYIEQLNAALATQGAPAGGYSPHTGPPPWDWPPPGFQRGAWEIPRRMFGVLDRGEMVLPAPVAERVRAGEGAVTLHIEHLHVGAGVTPHTAMGLAREISYKLGPMINRAGR